MNELSIGSQIAIFLVSAIFSLYIGAILIRMLLGFSRADFRNPLSQVLVKITNPVLVPIRRFIPAIGKIDTSAVVLAFILTVVKTGLIYLLSHGAVNLPQILLFSIGDIIKIIIYIYIFALIVQAVISWVGSAHGNPLVPLINSLTNPIVKPIRKYVPVIGMMDFSPLVAILLLNVLLIVVNNLFPY